MEHSRESEFCGCSYSFLWIRHFRVIARPTSDCCEMTGKYFRHAIIELAASQNFIASSPLCGGEFRLVDMWTIGNDGLRRTSELPELGNDLRWIKPRCTQIEQHELYLFSRCAGEQPFVIRNDR